MIEYLDTPRGRLAYARTEGQGPVIVFLSGLKSDMDGTKAVHLEAWAKAQGRAFLRFDYSGHGQSDGAFEDGSIADWHADTLAVIDTLTDPRSMPLNRVFISSTESMATPALPTSPGTRG